MAGKPSFEQVMDYAKPMIRKCIAEFAKDSPHEQQEEISQEVFKRLWEVYPTLDAEAGWKSYVFMHCRGGVLDYIGLGRGFQENRTTLHGETPQGRAPKLTMRMVAGNTEDDLDLDQAVGAAGVFAEMICDPITINWELLCRMSSKDVELHAFAKYLWGFTIEEMSPIFGTCRTRVSQLISNFIKRFDDPKQADDPWFKQICFALGICQVLGMPEVDQSTLPGNPALGWKLEPVDLESLEPSHSKKEQDSQMSLFNGQEEKAE